MRCTLSPRPNKPFELAALLSRLRFNADTLDAHGLAYTLHCKYSDEHALLISDPDHSADEDRFILLGMSAALRTIVVCHCYRDKDEVIRIISARKATRAEQNAYKRGRLR